MKAEKSSDCSYVIVNRKFGNFNCRCFSRSQLQLAKNILNLEQNRIVRNLTKLSFARYLKIFVNSNKLMSKQNVEQQRCQTLVTNADALAVI